jgi:hypothetical protein
MRRIAPYVLLCAAACGDDASPDLAPDAGGALDASFEAAQPDASVIEEDARVIDTQPYVPPRVDYPREKLAQPFLLSQVGLYTDLATKTLAPDLIAYEPSYALWSDGALKVRHLRLPGPIDNSDPDHWLFPVGTVLFKEFRTPEKRLETRVIARVGSGERDYFFGAFVWRDDESDAELAWDGASNVRGTEHDVPDTKQCGTCHNGETGRVLGISAVQTANLALPLTVKREPYVAPAEALGYLHANCGHCHNPSGSSRPDTDLNLRLSVAQKLVDTTIPYQSSVNVKLQSFMGSALTLRIVPGEPEQSGVYFRMTQRGPRSQMPPIASEKVDPQGLQTVADFISGLAH